MLEATCRLKEYQLGKLSELEYSYEKTTVNSYSSEGRAEIYLITLMVDSQVDVGIIANILQMDVSVSKTEVIKFTPNVIDTQNPVGVKVNPTSNKDRIAELLLERARNSRVAGIPQGVPTFSYSPRGSDNKASDLTWLSQGYCSCCNISDQLFLVTVDGNKVILCNTCMMLEANEFDVWSYGAVDKSVKNLHTLSSNAPIQNQPMRRSSEYQEATFGEEL